MYREQCLGVCYDHPVHSFSSLHVTHYFDLTTYGFLVQCTGLTYGKHLPSPTTWYEVLRMVAFFYSYRPKSTGVCTGIELLIMLKNPETCISSHLLPNSGTRPHQHAIRTLLTSGWIRFYYVLLHPPFPVLNNGLLIWPPLVRDVPAKY